MSPCVGRVQAVLYLAGVPFTFFKYGSKKSDMPKSANGKLPAVTIDGECITDSYAILPRLKEVFPSVAQLDAQLSKEDAARYHAAETMFTESLYWTGCTGARWTAWESYSKTFKLFMSKAPDFFKYIFHFLVRKKIVAAYSDVGFGRMPDQLVRDRFQSDIDSVEVMLGEKTFFGGDSPCMFDATAYAFLWTITHLHGSTFDGMSEEEREGYEQKRAEESKDGKVPMFEYVALYVWKKKSIMSYLMRMKAVMDEKMKQ